MKSVLKSLRVMKMILIRALCDLAKTTDSQSCDTVNIFPNLSRLGSIKRMKKGQKTC